MCSLYKKGMSNGVIIPVELAQRIVDTAMRMVHRNVNIMNREGIIIATGHQHRQNTFHKGAKDVVETGSGVEIYPDELLLYPGALQGVNLPIELDEQVVGVIGVFGHPDEVRDTGRLVKMITELILERDLMQREMHSKSRLREQLIDIAVTSHIHELTPKLKRIAKGLGISLTVPRVVILADIAAMIAKLADEYGQSDLVAERVEDIITQNVQHSGLFSEHDVVAVVEDRIIILKAFASTFDEQSLYRWVLECRSFLSLNLGGAQKCGVGAIAHSAIDYHPSYRQASFCLNHCSEDEQVRSIYDKDLLVQYMLGEASNASSRLAFKEMVKRFELFTGTSPEVKRTIKTLLDSNNDINNTAARLHIHRNTLFYRLDRLEAETGLNPYRRLDDVVLCRLLLLHG